MEEITALACGCEGATTVPGLLFLVGWCKGHAPEFRTDLYVCGECGWLTTRFDRLERHVYAVHLGAQVA
jgi:hypothetical protein